MNYISPVQTSKMSRNTSRGHSPKKTSARVSNVLSFSVSCEDLPTSNKDTHWVVSVRFRSASRRADCYSTVISRLSTRDSAFRRPWRSRSRSVWCWSIWSRWASTVASRSAIRASRVPRSVIGGRPWWVWLRTMRPGVWGFHHPHEYIQTWLRPTSEPTRRPAGSGRLLHLLRRRLSAVEPNWHLEERRPICCGDTA